MQPERTAPRIRAALADGDRSTTEVAKAIGVTRDRARIVLRVLEEDGIVERVGVVRSGRVGMPATIWSLRP